MSKDVEIADETTAREEALTQDFAAMKALEGIGLLTFDLTSRSSSAIFRIIGKLPASYVDEDGRKRMKDRWAFEVSCSRKYPRKPPAVALSKDAEIPDSSFFEPRSLLRFFRKGALILHGSGVEWRLPEELMSQAERAVDYVLAFLWTANEHAMDDLIRKSIADFSREPLRSYGVTQILLKRDEPNEIATKERDLAETTDDVFKGPLPDQRRPLGGDPYLTPPHRARENGQHSSSSPTERRIKKFIVKEQEEPDNIISQERPSIEVLEPLTSSFEVGNTLFVTRDAVLQIFDHISWGKSTQDNVHEQGGVMVGLRSKTKNQEEFVVVTHALPANTDTRSSTYVRFDHGAWSDILHRLDVLKEENIVPPQALIIGWYHTHPNWLDCFMSGTDLRTQRSVFHRSWNYALVLNPQRRLVACFVGAEARPCGAAVV